jgi:hypothetical protein
MIHGTSNSVTDSPYTITFGRLFTSATACLADMQTLDGGDAANVRLPYKDPFAMEVLVAEESSRDGETGHTTEVIGYLVVE